MRADPHMIFENNWCGRRRYLTLFDAMFEEFRLYHRKDGKVVKENDDLLSATRYAIMLLRYAECPKDDVKVNWQRAITHGLRNRHGGMGWMN